MVRARESNGRATWVVALGMASRCAAQVHVLDDPASPIRVTFDDASARLSVLIKSTGVTWSNPATGGGSAVSVASVTQSSGTHLAAGASIGGVSATIVIDLASASGELTVTISGDPIVAFANVRYPYAFYPADGSGFMVMPVFDGFVVPTTQTTWTVPSGHSRLEWFGGVDSSFNAGWMMIGEPAADMELTAETGTINGHSRRGGAFKWSGSNANAGGLAGRLSYERRALIRFFAEGGYVAQAKHFRQYAHQHGWLVTLNHKAKSNADVNKMMGSPVIYLWGDGRSTTMLDELQVAGIDRAMIQVSINHVDHTNAFPNQASANGSGWAAAVRAHGYIPGIYDIYARVSTVQSQPPFNGFFYLWPTVASPQWVYRDSSGSLDAQNSVSNVLAASFARTTRLPAHLSQFGFDAYFSDVVGAVMPREDYDTTFGHFATRAQDIAGRQALLAAVSADHGKLAGMEQLKSWAIPYVHWGEGMFWLGGSPSLGTFNNNAYPEIMTDVKDPGASIGSILDVGFRVPLFELVFHDCVLAPVHWHRAHNKLLYAWDINDQFALLRGQAPLFNLVYAGTPGSIGRAITGATNAQTGQVWDTRWSTPHVRNRVLQTWNTVCQWHRSVGAMEMTDSRVLRSDFSVQLAEFSPDGGASGRGIVVNFGVFDGQLGVSGTPWVGSVRGTSLSVPVGGFATYQWPLVCYANCDGSTGNPRLTANDFQCFINRFAAGETYANCDGSSASPTLTSNDFQCFLNAFAAGCT